jgi:hypothetical protein
MTDSPVPRAHNEMRFPENPRTESFNAWDPEITAQIDALVQRAKQSDVSEEDISDLVREIVVTALKTQHSQLPRGMLRF